jgi:serine/threonine protein kinase/tetratricopeptide (TPR) repeat protein
MGADRWQRVEELFDRALALPPERRPDFLEKASLGDAELREEVRSLLEAHERGGGSIPSAVAGVASAWAREESTLRRTLGRFRMISPIGRGGMGEVWLAEDTKLGRKVALKLLPPEATLDPERLGRFQREARAASALNHPGILTVHDVDQIDGTHFIATEFVEGRTLRALLAEGPLSPARALDVTRQIAAALGAAHAAGIVHRDIKPENVMVRPDGLVKVLDFGLAKLTERSAQEPSFESTAVGAVFGTARYMSPEQARGIEVDSRSDIFSLGVVIYEMVSGRPPFEGATTSDIIASILTRDPPPLRETAADVPEALERVVRRALQKGREERYQTIQELSRDLDLEAPGGEPSPPSRVSRRRLWALSLSTAAAGLGLYLFWGAGRPIDSIGDLPFENASGSAELDHQADGIPEVKIVVLPFENLGGDDDQYFADGMTDEIANRLGTMPRLRVTSRTSARQYREKRPSVRQIGEELGVDYVLEGTVRWQHSAGGKSHVRVTPKLIKASEDRQLWSETYDAVLSDLFTLQSDIAQQVIANLGIALKDPRVAPEAPTQDLEAYDSYLRGRDYLHRALELNSAEQAKFAIGMFDDALRRDGSFALALAQRAFAHAWLYFWYHDRSDERARKAQADIEAALALDSELPDAHYAKAVLLLSRGEKHATLEELQLVLKRQPNHAGAVNFISHLQTELGNWKEGLASAKKAVELDPRSSYIACWAGGTGTGSWDYAAGVHYHDIAIKLAPDRTCHYFCKVEAYLSGDGNTVRARRVLREVPAGLDFEANPPLKYYAVVVEMMDGKYPEALAELSKGSAQVLASPWFYIPKDRLIAQIHGLLGNRDLEQAHYQKAVDILEKTAEERPEDVRVRSSLAVAYAGFGRMEEAQREVERAIELMDGSLGDQFPYRTKDLAQVQMMVGDFEKALDSLERLVKTSGYFGKPYLRIDPTFIPLRGHPRFVALVGDSPR